MGDQLPAALASGFLACVAGGALGTSDQYGWTHPFMHVNLTAHGVIGLLHYLRVDTGGVFPISMAAAKYLSLPGLNSDLYRRQYENEILPVAFLISGVVPLWLEVMGSKNDDLGRAAIACNIIALGYHAFTKESEWSWYTVGCAVFALLVSPIAAADVKVVFPLACAGMDYCAHRVFGYGGPEVPRGRR
ncbi:hypothetical protein NE865_02372 [Phthorimaea operculella]|nr:hypothetical protein NE865_02372 [Phthorimaea operculella]